MAKIRFKKKSRLEQEIPTGPMADISFLLIIFFMVTTVFVVYRGFPVNLPEVKNIDPLKARRNVVSIWISPEGRLMVDEFAVEVTDVANEVNAKLQENPRIIVQVKSDRDTPYRVVSGVIDELKKANANRVSFIARTEQ